MPTQVQDHVLRVPRSDREGDFVLVNIKPSGSSLLDIKIQATEGENPYVAQITQHSVSRFREKRHQKDKEEWLSILESILLQRQPSDSDASVVREGNVELVAVIANSQLTLIFRKNIEGITQRLGEIPLVQNEDVEIDTVGWAFIAVDRADGLSAELQALRGKYDEQEGTIQKLNQQLEDLITAKKEHEDALLNKFCDLLNAKKLKIRDYQRILAGAKVDEKQAAKVQNARGNSDGKRAAATSRKSKRKAVEQHEGESEDGDAFADEPEIKKEEIEMESERTPDATDEDVTEDEDDADDVLNRNVPGTAAVDIEMDTPPPSRELPFSKKDGPSSEATAASANMRNGHSSTSNQEAGTQDDDTTDDDEL